MIKLKIEIDVKELIVLLDYIKGQREPVGNADDLAKEVLGRIGSTVVDQITTHCVRTTSDEHGCSVNIQPFINWKL